VFDVEPGEDSMRGVALLARRVAVQLDHGVYGVVERTEFGLGPLVAFALWRDCSGDRLAYHAPVDAVFLRQSLDAGLLVPAAWLRRSCSISSTLRLLSIPESCHSGMDRVGQFRSTNWAKSDARTQG
jgi:hypothetical protein